MKWFIFIATSISLFGAATKPNSTQEKPKPFDADLFRKDEQICSGSVEFLYWTVAEGSVDYAIKMHKPSPSTSYANGHVQNATYNVDPGFRLGFIFYRAPSTWEVKWQYTRMTNRGENNSSKPSDADLYLTGTWPQIISELSTAKSYIHLNYNVADMLVDRMFIPNLHLRLRYIGGISTVWMDQDWNITYQSETDYTHTKNSWGYAGGGLKTGVMVDWFWTGELYFTGLASFAGYIGGYSNKSYGETNNSSYSSNPVFKNLSYEDVRAVFTIQALIGPSWQRNFKNNRIELFAGFETNIWFNVQESYRSSSGAPESSKELYVNSSALSLYGLTTRLTVDF